MINNSVEKTINCLCDWVQKRTNENEEIQGTAQIVKVLADLVTAYGSVEQSSEVVTSPPSLKVPRMRTIEECAKEIKAFDPETKLTVSGLKRMINDGEIGAQFIGNRTLINLDELINAFNNPSTVKKNNGSAEFKTEFDKPEEIVIGKKSRKYGQINIVQ